MSDQPRIGEPARKDEPASPQTPVGRRGVLQGLLGGVGAGFVLPLESQAHPIEHHMASPARMEQAAARAAQSSGGAPEFLDAYAIETFGSMAERIVPGSAAAGVAVFVDSLLAVDKPENQRRFLNALGAMEAECRSRFGRPWRSLTEAQQTELLTAASTAAPTREEATWPRASARTSEPEKDVVATLRDHFDHLKKWVVGAYYSSPAGMKELGYTGQQFFQSFPGCTHPEGHS
jgi:hypothetical protein